MNLEEWKSSGKWTNIQDINIFYRYEGNGPYLLLLHAYPTASWGWHKMWDWLINNFTVIAPDLPGSGFSDKPKKYEYSILSLANVVQSLIREQVQKPVHVLAHAYGSSVAQELLQRHHDEKISIKSVYFINGGIFPEVARTTFMQRFLITVPGALLAQTFPTPYQTFRKNILKTFSAQHQPTEEELLTYWYLLTYNQGHKRVPRVIQYIRERRIFRERWVNAMQQADIPMGLLLSTQDPLIDRETANIWQKLFPEYAMDLIDTPSGHYPPLEIPHKVRDAYRSFIQLYFGKGE